MGSTTSPPFVGRHVELAALNQLTTATTADYTTLLIGGEAGVGKTRLVEEFTDHLDQSDVTVATGGCIPTAHGSLPFVAIIEALKELCSSFAREEVESAMPAAPELALLLPEYSAMISSSASSESADTDSESQIRLFEAVSDLLSTLSTVRPVCVVIEDLHWADKSTRDLFVFLVHSLSASRAVLVATYRSDEMSRTHPFRPLLAELDRSQRVDHRILEPFDSDELVGFAAAILDQIPTARLLDELADRSGGNAFFAVEILDAFSAGRHTVRPELADLILSRIESLSEPTQELMRLFAVSGRSVRDELLEQVADFDESDIIGALREAIDHQVIVLSRDGPLRFRHALMQEAVYSTLLPRERQRAHARYAEVLTNRPDLSATPESHQAELAWHFREAKDLERALQASVAAARSSIGLLAFSEALGHVETVLELWDETEEAPELAAMDYSSALQWAAELADTAGDYPRSVQFQRAAIEASQHLSEQDKVRLYLRLGRFLQNAGRASESLGEYERAIAAVPATASRERALALAGYGQQLMLSLRSDESVGVLEEAIAIARETGALETEANALNSLGSVLLHQGNQPDGVAMLWQSHDIAVRTNAPQEILRVHVNLVGGLNEAGNLEEAERVGLEGMSRALDLGQERGFGFFIASNLCETLTEMARWDESAALAERIKRPEGELAHTWLVHHMVDRLIRTGGLDEADRLLQGLDARTVSRLNPQLVPGYWIRSADLSHASGDVDASIAAVEEGLLTAQVLSHNLTLRAKAIAVCRDSATAAETQTAEPHLAEIERLVEERLAPGDETSFRILALQAQARAEMAQMRGEDPTELWTRAADLWGQGRFVWHRARCQYVLGSHLVQTGRRAEASPLLFEVRELAGQIGAKPLEADARQLIDHAGLEPDGEEERGLLTPRELSVLNLVSEGRTNRQIGDELFISPKTVSVHLSRIFQKLQVENRTEAAAAARRAGLIQNVFEQ